MCVKQRLNVNVGLFKLRQRLRNSSFLFHLCSKNGRQLTSASVLCGAFLNNHSFIDSLVHESNTWPLKYAFTHSLNRSFTCSTNALRVLKCFIFIHSLTHSLARESASSLSTHSFISLLNKHSLNHSTKFTSLTDLNLFKYSFVQDSLISVL